MARQARGELIDPGQVQVVHCVQRCVRRAFLCGKDPLTGKSYEHRREWMRSRLEFLASVFGIDCLTYTVMSNHVHQVLRSRPDIVANWTDEEVARRWLRLCPTRKNVDGSPAEPKRPELDLIVQQKEFLQTIRQRLSDISWWMKAAAEYIARRSNREDKVTGHFWEGRYRAQVLLDEPSILACAAYVDLNPIRAALASTPEDCKFTGAKDRLDDLTKQPADRAESLPGWERSPCRKRSGWLSPVELTPTDASVPPDPRGSPRRASEKGFLSVSLLDYLQLLDWTGRQIRKRQRGVIPSQLAPILARIGLAEPDWCDLVQRFSKYFKRAAGTTERLREEAARRGQRWLQAPDNRLRTVS